MLKEEKKKMNEKQPDAALSLAEKAKKSPTI